MRRLSPSLRFWKEKIVAFVEQRGQWYRVIFRYQGKRFTHTLKTQDRSVAEGLKGGIEKTLMLLGQKLLVVPPGVDVLSFVFSMGQMGEAPALVEASSDAADTPITLEQLKDRYIETHSAGAMEQNSLDTVAMHLRHFIKTLGAGFTVERLTLAKLQDHVNRRARNKGIRKRPLSPVTIRKEIATLRATWNWAGQMGLVTGPFPNRGLTYPKTDEKPPFQTRKEIEGQISLGLTKLEARELWDCLFLTLPEIERFLKFVESKAGHPFIHPMCCFAAHTGARRSEMLRARISDVDLGSGTVLIRERKRAKGNARPVGWPCPSSSLACLRTGWPFIPVGSTFSAFSPTSLGAKKDAPNPPV
jgi:integrase